MNYELAFELKNAGFRNDYWEPSIETERPTLEELIGACETKDLGNFKLEHTGYGWLASVNNETRVVFSNPKAFECSKDPTTAAANLWLALNKK